MPSPSPVSEFYCLKWKYHHSNLQVMFAQLLEQECYCDVTLACEGQTLRAHKIVLSACSPYFDSIFTEFKDKDPIVILKNIKFEDMRALIEFMYKGEIDVENSQLNSLLQTAEELRIKGLAEVSWRSEEDLIKNKYAQSLTTVPEANVPNESQPSRKRKSKEVTDIGSCKVSNCSPTLTREDFISESDEDSQDLRICEDDYSEPRDTEAQPDKTNGNDISISEETNPDSREHTISPTPSDTSRSSISSLPSAVREKFKNVVKMTPYIQQGGRRPHFWERSSTKMVMEAIKNKEIGMKMAAGLLGVSYGTLYGRYRDAYGFLKHSYKFKEFWKGAQSFDVIRRLQSNELSIDTAAGLLNMSVSTLTHYLEELNKMDTDDDVEVDP